MPTHTGLIGASANFDWLIDWLILVHVCVKFHEFQDNYSRVSATAWSNPEAAVVPYLKPRSNRVEQMTPQYARVYQLPGIRGIPFVIATDDASRAAAAAAAFGRYFCVC